MTQPTNFKDLRCFLGMVNYLNNYSSRLEELSDSLRELTKKNGPFLLGPEYTEAFDNIKITSGPILKYYDPKTSLTLEKGENLVQYFSKKVTQYTLQIKD